MARKSCWPLCALAIFWLLPDQWRFIPLQPSSWTASHLARVGRVACRAALIKDLEIGESCSGTVVEVKECGATLDLGLDKPGWLHVSEIEKPEGVTYLKSAGDVLKEGDEVQVRVKRVQHSSVGVTMLDLPDFKDLEIGESCSGTVVEVKEYGATLDLGLDRPGWLHVSEIVKPEGVTYLKSAEEVLKKGDEVQVRVKSVKRTSVRVTMLDSPDFQKKPLSEYKVGDEVEGTVVNVLETSVYIDVGAVLAGILPRRKLNGDIPEALGFELGKVVKVRVEDVTTNQIILDQVG